MKRGFTEDRAVVEERKSGRSTTGVPEYKDELACYLLPEWCWWWFYSKTQNPCTRVLRGGKKKLEVTLFCRRRMRGKILLGRCLFIVTRSGESACGSAVPCLSLSSVCLLPACEVYFFVM